MPDKRTRKPTQQAPAPVEGGNNSEEMTTMQGTDAVVVNWAAAKGDYDSPITPGDHVGVLIEKEYNPSSKSSGQPTMKLTWKIPALNDRKISHYYSLQPNALWALRQAMVAHGASPEVMNAENANLFDTINSVMESQAVLEIGLQKDNPEYNEVKKVKPLSSLK